MKKLLLAAFCLSCCSALSAQWWEEQDYIRSSVQGRSVRTIDVFGQDYLLRQYEFDRDGHYLGFEHYNANGDVVRQEINEYDENGFLIQRALIDKGDYESETRFYHYDSTGNLESVEICRATLGFDWREKEANWKLRCPRERYEYDDHNRLVAQYYQSEPDSPPVLQKKYLYGAKSLLLEETQFVGKQGKPRYSIFHEYTLWRAPYREWLGWPGERTCKIEWEYDDDGRVATLTTHAIFYLPKLSQEKKWENSIRDNHQDIATNFEYDKEGFIVRTESFMKDKLAAVLVYRYNLF